MSKKKSLACIGLFLLVIGVLFYLMNLYTPLTSDDFLYSFYLTPVAAKSFLVGPFCGFEQKILSIADIFSSQYNHYFYTNGRTVPHLLEQLFAGLIGKKYFNVLNVFFLLFLNLLIVWLSDRSKMYSFSYWVTAFLLLWLLLPYPGDIFLSMVCAINYLWSAVFCLSFLVVYNKIKYVENVHWVVAGLLFLIGLISGWTHEALSIGISGGLFLYYCMHYERIRKPEVLMVVGFGVGTLLICLSPAAHERALVGYSSLGETIMMIAGELRAFYVFLLCFVFCFAKKSNRYKFKSFVCENQLFLCVILVEFLFGLFIGYRNVRQLFGIELFSIILSLRLIGGYLSFAYARFKPFSVIIAGLIIVHMICVIPYSKCSHRQFEQLVVSYIQSEDGTVHFKQMTFPWWVDPYVWRFGEYVAWQAPCVSIYYTGNKKPMKVLSLD